MKTPDNPWRQTTGVRPLILAATFLCIGLGATSVSRAVAQDVKPVSSGAIQSVRAGVSANMRAGVIARGPGGERAGGGGFGTSELTARVVSGKVAGYGGAQTAGRMPEYSSQGGSGFGTNRDFPDTDFVATMPKPGFGGSTASAGTAGLGLSAPKVSIPARATHRSTHSTHRMRDPNAILNPFTHSIGGGAIGGTGLGSGSIH